MLPLLPFVAGIATGALALKYWRADKSKLKLDQAQEKIRQATVSSLEAIENSSASMRKRLNAKLAAPEAEIAPAVEAAAEAAPAKKVAAKKPTAKKPTAKKVADAPAVKAES